MCYEKKATYTILDCQGAHVYVYNRTTRSLACLDDAIVVLRDSRILLICQDPSRLERLTDADGESILRQAKENGTFLRFGDGEVILPGFIDVHVHGGGGYEINEATRDAIEAMSIAHLLHGTTTIVPTVVTASKEEIIKCLRIISEYTVRRTRYGAHIEGGRLESNYFAEAKAGVHNPSQLCDPSVEELIEYIRASTGPDSNKMTLIIVTYAPERDDKDYTYTRTLLLYGIIPSIGHTNATEEQVINAFRQGVCLVCHLPNALSSRFRYPFGAIEGVLESLRRGLDIMVEVIADGVHVSPDVLRDTIIYPLRNAPGGHGDVIKENHDNNVLLISDGRGPAGSMLTDYMLPEECIRVCEHVRYNGKKYRAAYLVDNSKPQKSWTLAGSVAPLRDEVLNISEWLNDFETALKLATINPARALGISNSRGAIAAGYYADIVVYDSKETLVPKCIFVEGQMIDIEQARKQLKKLTVQKLIQQLDFMA